MFIEICKTMFFVVFLNTEMRRHKNDFTCKHTTNAHTQTPNWNAKNINQMHRHTRGLQAHARRRIEKCFIRALCESFQNFKTAKVIFNLEFVWVLLRMIVLCILKFLAKEFDSSSASKKTQTRHDRISQHTTMLLLFSCWHSIGFNSMPRKSRVANI